ncbi:MAG TPA: acyl-CoA thioesterase [Chloroflexota bacterium]|nr:acyl-CoA thioesterase [Chloroflexota bacterium]
MEAKPPSASHVTISQVMLISDANPQGNVHGGTIMKLVDTAGALAALRHGRRRVVTVEMDSMRFHEPVQVGNLVTLTARVTAVWRTSLETYVDVEAEDVLTGERRHTSSAFLVFVALDDAGRPTELPPLLLETEADRAMAEAAEARRQRRLAERAARPER